MVGSRWDGDARGIGVGHATDAAPAIGELRDLALLPGWISEEPGVHLGSHLAEAADEVGLAVESQGVEANGRFRVVLTYDAAAKSDRRTVRRAAWRVIGAIAEASTHVLERETADGTEFTVVTGMPSSSTAFATHGHSLALTLKPRSG